MSPLPSLLSTNLTVTSALDHKIQRKINTPSHDKSKTKTSTKTSAQTCRHLQLLSDHLLNSIHSQAQSESGLQQTHSETFTFPSSAGPFHCVMTLQVMALWPQKHPTVTCADGQRTEVGRLELHGDHLG